MRVSRAVMRVRCFAGRQGRRPAMNFSACVFAEVPPSRRSRLLLMVTPTAPDNRSKVLILLQIFLKPGSYTITSASRPLGLFGSE